MNFRRQLTSESPFWALLKGFTHESGYKFGRVYCLLTKESLSIVKKLEIEPSDYFNGKLIKK